MAARVHHREVVDEVAEHCVDLRHDLIVVSLKMSFRAS
jgi:hypothetical protein